MTSSYLTVHCDHSTPSHHRLMHGRMGTPSHWHSGSLSAPLQYNLLIVGRGVLQERCQSLIILGAELPLSLAVKFRVLVLDTGPPCPGCFRSPLWHHLLPFSPLSLSSLAMFSFLFFLEHTGHTSAPWSLHLHFLCQRWSLFKCPDGLLSYLFLFSI